MEFGFAKYALPIAVFLLALAGCAAGIRVVPSGAQTYQPSAHVDVLTAKPAKPYIVIGSFSGGLSNTCPASDRYCELRKQAMALGADAVWIQATDVTDFPSQWIMVQGRLTHLYAHQNTHVRGVILRYNDGTR